MLNKKNVSINHCFFMDNEALAGGDILFWTASSSIQINNCIFKILQEL